jgi:hypothetical protein
LTGASPSASMQIVSDEERARFEVLLEQINDRVGVIAEGHGALNARMDTVSSRLEGLGNDLQVFRHEVGQRFAGVETRLDRVEAHLKNGHTARPPKRPSTKRRPTKK